MKILADTNILISALLYPRSNPGIALMHIADNYSLILTDYNISELHRVTKAKFPEKLADVDVLLAELTFELIVAPLSPQKLIAGPKDAPILNAAILADVDIILSGDKHFRELQIERPKVMTVAEYIEWADIE